MKTINNYQEALEVISQYIGNYDNNSMLDVAMNDLQRLIYEYDNGSLKYEYEKLYDKYVVLNKVVDKACEKLVELKDSADCYEFESCPFRNVCSTDTNHCGDKDKWKEYLLKEGEEE